MENVVMFPAISTNLQQMVFGPGDLFIRKIEKKFNVTIQIRDDAVKIEGADTKIRKAYQVLQTLIALSEKNGELTEQQVDYAMILEDENKSEQILEIDQEVILHTISGTPVKPKTLGQKTYVDHMRKKMITFGVGPAGTGKTYLAIAMAVRAFKNQEVKRIILTRPAIEAGEKLGFLPGDLQSKVDPYLRPLYDALYQMMGAESFAMHMEKGEIEVAPLAYMRGRTLDGAYIILDEAQNTTPAQMKMFLTRIGFGSKCVVTGDRTQKDLPRDQESGLDVALKILKKLDEIGVAELSNKDVVRHPLVQKIVKAYEEYENRPKKDTKKKKF